MKKPQINLKPYYRYLCIVAAAVGVVFAFLRIVLTPLAFDQPAPYGVALGATLLLVAVFLAFCALDGQRMTAFGGRVSRFVSASAIILGATFVIFSFAAVFLWLTEQQMPFPQKPMVGTMDEALLYIYLIAGLLSGVLFAFLAIRWLHDRKTTRGLLPLLALAPVVWSWVRIIRYITSYVSTTGLFRNLYDLATIVFELLFFVLFAHYIARVNERRSRFFFGVSLCTGVLCTVSGVSQVVFFLMQDQQAFNTCILVTAPDFAVALFAFAMAFAHAYGMPCEEEPCEPEAEEVAEQPDPSEEDPEDGPGAEFLLSDEMFTVYDPEENGQDDD